MQESFDNNAHSLDGLEFFFESELDSHLSIGDFVCLQSISSGIRNLYLGIIESAEIVSNRFAGFDNNESSLYITPLIIRSEGIRGSGRILGRIDLKEFKEPSKCNSFDHYFVSSANEEAIEIWATYKTKKNIFSIGKLLNYRKISVPLFSENLSRHTFLSGQTGSGKSSAIRTILKRILQTKDKPKIIVFDLNSEYKDICNKNTGSGEFRNINLSPKMNNEDGNELINIDFFQMEDDWKLSIIDIDPIENPNEFYDFRKGLQSYFDTIRDSSEPRRIKDLIDHLKSNVFPYSKESGYSFDNIDIHRWDIWKPEDAKHLLNEVLIDDHELINIDLGSIKTKKEKLAVASFILEFLWRNRENEQKFLIVIDEAHNIVPRVPINLISQNIIERMIDIAGEGRKYGIYLFLCSQQPSKIHENVLSLCNNLILLQTTSSKDLEFIYSKFSSVPHSFINKARFLNLGEAIISGPFVKTPIFLKIDHLR